MMILLNEMIVFVVYKCCHYLFHLVVSLCLDFLDIFDDDKQSQALLMSRV